MFRAHPATMQHPARWLNRRAFRRSAVGNRPRKAEGFGGADMSKIYQSDPEQIDKDARFLKFPRSKSSRNARAQRAGNSYDEYGIPAGANVGRFQYTGQTWLPEAGYIITMRACICPALAGSCRRTRSDIAMG